MRNEGEYTIDLVLFDGDGLTAELDFYIAPAVKGAESDWDSRDHLELYEYRVYSKGCEIELEIDEGYLYDELRKELRKRTLDAYCSGDVENEYQFGGL